MRRVHLIELHEQSWFPKFLRDEITDTLQNAMNRFGAYAPIVPLLQSVLNSTSSASIIDMCSGGGGPWLDLSRRLQKIAPSSLQILLTDKYPNLAAFQSAGAASQNHITFHSAPVDATKVPPELRGFRTMFTSFHHFEPAEARAILQNAVDAGQAIGIFEVTRRAPRRHRADVSLGAAALPLHSVDSPLPLVAPALHLCASPSFRSSCSSMG